MKRLDRNQWIGVAASLVVLTLLLFGGSIMDLFKSTNQMTQEDKRELPKSGVATEDLVVGSGDEAKPGNRLTVHYIGMLPDGKVFDSSLDRNMPFTFTLGVGDVIKGWDEGMEGMKVGGQRRLVIAPDYGYGASAIGAIPPESTLIFDVVLIGVEKGSE